MSREITEHKVNECNEALTIEVRDEPSDGSACHVYVIRWDSPHLALGEDTVTLRFQNGPIKEVGTNGITQEVLLAIVADRLIGFQSGTFACDENEQALTHVRAAQYSLQSRTKRRVAAGVEGTHEGN